MIARSSSGLDRGHRGVIALLARFAELSVPVDPAAVARGADSPEAAAEIYLASRLVIDPDHPSEQRYLDDLVQHLKLDAALVSKLETQVTQA